MPSKVDKWLEASKLAAAKPVRRPSGGRTGLPEVHCGPAPAGPPAAGETVDGLISWTKKSSRDYISTEVTRQGSSPSPIRRVPAAQIEDAVIAQIRAMVQTPEILVATWRAARKSRKGLTERQVRDELSRFDALWSELFPAEQARLVQLLVDRVDISAKGVEITLRVEGLTSLMQELHTAACEQRTAA